MVQTLDLANAQVIFTLEKRLLNSEYIHVEETNKLQLD